MPVRPRVCSFIRPPYGAIINLRLGSDGYERSERRVGPDDRRVREGHFHAPETLRIAVGPADETVQGVATIEIRDPRDALVVVGLAVRFLPRHRGHGVAKVHGERTALRGGDAEPSVDGGAEKCVIVDVERQRLGLGLGDVHVGVGVWIDLVLASGAHDALPRGAIHLTRGREPVDVLKAHERTLQDHVIGTDAPLGLECLGQIGIAPNKVARLDGRRTHWQCCCRRWPECRRGCRARYGRRR